MPCVERFSDAAPGTVNAKRNARNSRRIAVSPRSFCPDSLTHTKPDVSDKVWRHRTTLSSGLERFECPMLSGQYRVRLVRRWFKEVNAVQQIARLAGKLGLERYAESLPATG